MEANTRTGTTGSEVMGIGNRGLECGIIPFFFFLCHAQWELLFFQARFSTALSLRAHVGEQRMLSDAGGSDQTDSVIMRSVGTRSSRHQHGR
jgi:hypothetical protein